MAHMPVEFKFTFNIFMFSFCSDSDKKQGNCLRLFALLEVSAEALRITFDTQPESFEEKINQIMSILDKKTTKSAELFSRNTLYFFYLS